jgi:hypothetical protein
MGVCVKTFDEIRHLFAVSVAGNIRYDVVLMDAVRPTRLRLTVWWDLSRQ